MKRIALSTILAAGIAVATIPTYSFAQDTYPERPISVAACYPAGGGVDRNLRMVERVVAKYLGQSFLPQYRTGGSGSVAMQYIKDADPSGYELAICDNGGAIIAPIAQGIDLGPDDVLPIAQISFVPWVLTVRGESPYQSLNDLIKAAQESDEPISVEISDIASSDHYGWLLLLKSAGLSPSNFKWTPHGGGGPKMRAILAAEGDLLLEDAGEISQHVQEGMLRPLAVMAPTRLPELPDVPTLTELGHDVVAGSSVVLYAPAGLAADRVERLRTAMSEIKEDPALLKAFELTAQDPNTFVVEGFEETWRNDWGNATTLLKEALAN